MNALPQPVPLTSPPPAAGGVRVSPDELAECVRGLDPGSRALLDLSLRRRLPFEAMAGVLHTDPFDLARRRARAVARIAAELDLEGAGVVATVKAALARLPDDAWGVPVARAAPPRAPSRAVQGESMADAARALMERLREQREAMRVEEAGAGEPAGAAEPEAIDPAEQPTVETEVIVLPPEAGGDPDATPQAWPAVAATPMAAAYSHHPAFAVEAEPQEPSPLPPLADALARAAAEERAAAERAAIETPAADPPPQPGPPSQPAPAPRATARPAPPLASPHGAERESGRRIARNGLVIGLLLALLRLLIGRR